MKQNVTYASLSALNFLWATNSRLNDTSPPSSRAVRSRLVQHLCLCNLPICVTVKLYLKSLLSLDAVCFYLQPSEFYNLQHREDIFGAIFDKVYVPVLYVTNLYLSKKKNVTNLQVMLFKLSLLLVIKHLKLQLQLIWLK